jgi:hypothetical protein
LDAISQLEQAGCNLLIGVRKKKDFGFLSDAGAIKMFEVVQKKVDIPRQIQVTKKSQRRHEEHNEIQGIDPEFLVISFVVLCEL